MLGSQQRRLDQFQSKAAFMRANKADFPANSPGGKTAQALEVSIGEILALAAAQSSNLPAQHISNKDDSLEDLWRLMKKINRAARSLADEHDNIEDLFRLPRRQTEQNILAAARTFHRDSAAYEEDFPDYNVPETFRADLLDLVAEIESSAQDADAAGAEKSGATGAMLEKFRQAGKQSKKLSGIVENKYDDNPQKLAEWRIASHLKAAPQRNTAKKTGNKDEPDSK